MEGFNYINLIYILIITTIVIILSNVIYSYFYGSLKQLNLTSPNVKKKFDKEYLVMAIISFIFIVYFISIRYFNDWQRLANYSGTGLSEYSHSIIYSKALLLDLCAFLGLALPFAILLDKTKTSSIVLAPFAIFGGLITIPFIPYNENNIEFNLEYIFVGTKRNPLYFMIHLYLLTFGILCLRRKIVSSYKVLLYMHIFAGFYFSYIYIISNKFNVVYNVTGIVQNDWTNPVLGSFYGVTNITKIPYPYVSILSYLVSYIVIVAIFFIDRKKKNNFFKKILKKLFK